MLLCLFLFGEPLRLAVASNFRHTLEPLVKKFEQDRGVVVQVSYGSSGKLVAQLVHGAPFNVFLSADNHHVDLLVNQNVVDSSTRIVYAQGILVLWWLDGMDQADALQGKVAVANPRLAPYGKAAEQALKSMGVEPQRITAENVGQVAHFVLSGNVTSGFCSLAQVQFVGKGRHWVVPQEFYQPIMQEAVVVKTNEHAIAFMDFLRSPFAQEHIEQSGYRAIL